MSRVLYYTSAIPGALAQSNLDDMRKSGLQASFRNGNAWDGNPEKVDGVVIDDTFPAIKEVYERAGIKVQIVETEKPDVEPKKASEGKGKATA